MVASDSLGYLNCYWYSTYLLLLNTPKSSELILALTLSACTDNNVMKCKLLKIHCFIINPLMGTFFYER